MSLSDLTSREAVIEAIEECRTLGPDKFLAQYGFGPAKKYLVRFNGVQCDSKAIAGVAHKYQFPSVGALDCHDFSGGITDGAAAKKLSDLGFEIVDISSTQP